MRVLVVAEHRFGQVTDLTRELITAGRELGPVTVAVIGREPNKLVDAVNLEGVDDIMKVSAPVAEFETDLYQVVTEALVARLKPRVTLLGFTANSMAYGPAVALRNGLGFASDVHAVVRAGDEVIATRSFYGGRINAELDFPGVDGVLLLLRPTAWAPAGGHGGAQVTRFELPAERHRTRHLELVEMAVSADVDITRADFLVSIGRGIGEEKNIEMFRRLAQKMGAILTVSRPLVDAGWMPASRLVGLSGRTVKPDIYLAFGISGAVQHLAGMKASGTTIAVNTDPTAAIFGVAEYGAAADAFDVAEELEKLY